MYCQGVESGSHVGVSLVGTRSSKVRQGNHKGCLYENKLSSQAVKRVQRRPSMSKSRAPIAAPICLGSALVASQA